MEFSGRHLRETGTPSAPSWCNDSRYGGCNYKPEGKWNSIASQMVQRFKETGHAIFTSAGALRRGILRKLKGKDTVHFNADTSNTELLFRMIHSANQLSIYGAVSKWCEEFGLKPEERGPKFADKENSVKREILKSVNSQEVKSLACAPRTTAASGNGLQEHLQNFESLSRTVQFTRICELASFWLRADLGKKYKTIPVVDDGFGDSIPACREYILHRLDLHSRVFAAIPEGAVIGPVLEVHIVLLHGKHGLEINIPSLNDPNRTSWVVICRGKNRFVNELHIPNPEHNLTISELPEERQEIEPCSVEQEPSSTRGTCAEQFRTLPDPMCFTKELIPMKERNWKSIPAYESYKCGSLSASISKMVIRSVACVIMIKMNEKSTEHFVGIR